jgi:hypothetical protein
VSVSALLAKQATATEESSSPLGIAAVTDAIAKAATKAKAAPKPKPITYAASLNGKTYKIQAGAKLSPEEQIREFVGGIEEVIGKCVDVMPRHADYIAQHCAAPRM